MQNETPIRRLQHKAAPALLSAVAMILAAPAAAQQQRGQEPPQAPRAQEAPPAPRVQEPPATEFEAAEPADEPVADLERARNELEAARRNLEAAAREVARLSAQAVGPVVRDLRRQWLGTGQRAMLGLAIEDGEDGALVSAVSPGGPAAEAGIRISDVIVAIDGQPLAGRSPSRTLINRLSDVEPGTVVSLDLRRNDAASTVSVTTREREQQVFTFEGPRLRLESLPGAGLFLGADRWSSMELVPISPELGAYFGTDEGLLVVRAPNDESLPLRDGDVILAIGGREPNSPEHAMRILSSFEAGEMLELTIMRNRQPETLQITLPQGPGNGEPA